MNITLILFQKAKITQLEDSLLLELLKIQSDADVSEHMISLPDKAQDIHDQEDTDNCLDYFSFYYCMFGSLVILLIIHFRKN